MFVQEAPTFLCGVKVELDRSLGRHRFDGMDFALKPGDTIRRLGLHKQYGGQRQGGIGPSKVTPNVFLFSDPASGHKHGYFDGWGDDGCYHYAGEGQVGDQVMKRGNLAIKNHWQDGRALRLFDGARGTIIYVGEFTLAAERSWYLDDAPGTGTDEIRSVIMFRLLPIETATTARPWLPETPHPRSEVSELDIEQIHTERSYVNPSRQPYVAERHEAELVRGYEQYLSAHGHRVSRHKIVPPNELKPLFTDLYDATSHTLVEAKGTVTREAVRMAIGQLLDYKRFLPEEGEPASLAVLLPREPRGDLIRLCNDNQITVIWPDNDRYVCQS